MTVPKKPKQVKKRVLQTGTRAQHWSADRIKDPGPTPSWIDEWCKDPGPKSEVDRQRAEAALYAHSLREIAYKAVHVNDKFMLDWMAELALFHLQRPDDVPQGVREWLIYVISEMHRRDTLPKAPRVGRAIDRYTFFTRQRQLFEIVRAAPKGEHRTAMLERAAKQMAVSYYTVRGIFYSSSFKIVYWSFIRRSAGVEETKGGNN